MINSLSYSIFVSQFDNNEDTNPYSRVLPISSIWSNRTAFTREYGECMKEKISCIYKISSLIYPTRFYIGSTINYDNRKQLHLKHFRANKHHSILLQRHINKYGLGDMTFSIIEVVPIHGDLLSREQFYIDSLNPFFNICKVAGNCLGVKLSDETKAKMSKAKTGIVCSESTRQKISNANKGIKKTPLQIEVMRKRLIGRKLSEEHKKKISNSSQNRKPISEETRMKLSTVSKNRIYSLDARKNMSEAAKNRKPCKRGKYKTAKRYRPEEEIITEDGGNQIMLQLTA